MFEPVHGSAPDIAGQGIANPMAQVLTAAMMLDHIDEPEAAADLRRATESVLATGETLTPDLGGSSTTSAVGRRDSGFGLTLSNRWRSPRRCKYGPVCPS